MAGGVHCHVVPKYFNMKDLFNEAVQDGFVYVANLEFAREKVIYENLTTTFPPPKVVYKHELPFDLIWQRLENPVMDGSAKNLFFKMINNIVPNRGLIEKDCSD